jgi:hypothetical protein
VALGAPKKLIQDIDGTTKSKKNIPKNIPAL